MEVIDIVHEVPGRMRVRLPEALTFKQADLIQWCLKKKAQIDKVSILIRTSDIIIEYHDLSRRQLIDMLLQIDLKDQVLLEKAPDSGIEISSEYWDQLVSLIVSRVFRRVFFPVTLRDILAVIHSIPFIIKGIKHLFKKEQRLQPRISQPQVPSRSCLKLGISLKNGPTANPSRIWLIRWN